MKISSATKTISVGKNTIPIFEKLDKIIPNHISFSLMIAIACEEWIKNHDNINGDLTQFTSQTVSTELPLFYADIIKWKNSIKKLSDTDFLKLQQRYSQLGNLINKEVSQRL